MFDLELAPFEGDRTSCQTLAASVKQYLSQEVSSDPMVQMSFQSIKKLLPDSCRCMESDLLNRLVEKIGSPPLPLPKGYLAFVRKKTLSLFPKGWDRSYERYCLTTSPPLTSTTTSSRREGGMLGDLVDQPAYLDAVLHSRLFDMPESFEGELMVVQSSGKPRPLVKASSDSLLLRPLHKTIYDYLSRKKWCLRGPPTEEALREAGFREGRGNVVSGDYVSATDNLPVEVMEEILKVLGETCTFVPPMIFSLALSSCRAVLYGEGGLELEVSRGQMMGFFLSFPLLCLQNFLSFSWALSQAKVRSKVPLVINGDDILFQEPFPGFHHSWRKVVGAVGLEVEVSKTSVSRSYGTINSTLLEWSSGLLKPVWTARFGMFRPCSYPGGLGKSFLDFLRGCPPTMRFFAGREWFRWHVSELRSAAVSLPSLGFRGLLAARLGSLFSLAFPDVEELPSFEQHGVWFSNSDFVTRVPRGAVDEELQFASSLEVASAKWREGWCPVQRESAAIRYCLELTAIRGRSRLFDYPATGFTCLSCTSAWLAGVPACYDPGHRVPWYRSGKVSRHHRSEFEVVSTSFSALPWCSPLTRRETRKSFLRPIAAADYVLVVTSLVLDLSVVTGRGPLPPYSTADSSTLVEVAPFKRVVCG